MRYHNFSGGPGALPESVIQEARQALERLPDIPLSVLGISHRSEWFYNVVQEAKQNIKQLLNLTADFHVLFLQGGSTLQFSMIPMTLLKPGQTADYLCTGYWSQKAIPEARKVGQVNVLWNGESCGYKRLPAHRELNFLPEAGYFHYVSNETVEGVQFHEVMGLDSVTRVCDMSSDFLCRPLDANRFDLVYAHAQKNLGPAGVTIVLIKEKLLQQVPENLPAMITGFTSKKIRFITLLRFSRFSWSC